MVKGHEAGDGDARPGRGSSSGSGSSPSVAVVALGAVALAAAAASLVACLLLDARARDQLAEVRTQLTAANTRLDQLTARLQAINNTVLAQSLRRYNGVPEEDDRYGGGRTGGGEGGGGGGEEDYEYDYDDDEDYDEEDTPVTVKRTTVLSEDVDRGGVNFTEPYGSRRQAHRTSRAILEADREAADTVEGEDDPVNDLQLRAARTQITSSQTASNRDQRNFRAQPAKNNKKRKKNVHADSVQLAQVLARRTPAAHFVGTGNHTVKLSGRIKHIYEAKRPTYTQQPPPDSPGSICYNMGRPAQELENGSSSDDSLRTLVKSKNIADWVESSESSGDSFTLRNGTLTVHRPGLYYVYAQVYFMTHQDTSAFHIDRNEEEIAYCVVSNNWVVARHDHGNHKENTCFTSSVVALQAGDTLVVVESEFKRYSRFLVDKSAYMFFGLFLISDT